MVLKNGTQSWSYKESVRSMLTSPTLSKSLGLLLKLYFLLLPTATTNLLEKYFPPTTTAIPGTRNDGYNLLLSL